MDVSGFLPQWCADHMVGDRAFAAAWDAVGDETRARMKSLLAALYDFHPPRRDVSASCSETLATGISRRTLARPPEYILLAVSETDRSWVRLLAALLPALNSGAPAAAAMAVGREGFDDGQLAALELAGLEQTLHLEAVEFERLAAELAASPLRGLVLSLGQGCRIPSVSAFGTWHDPAPEPLGVYSPGGAIDIAAVAAAHPDRKVVVVGAGSDAENVRHADMDWPEFAGQDFQAVYLDDPRTADENVRSELVLGPGCEWFWTWPDLAFGMLELRRAVLHTEAT